MSVLSWHGPLSGVSRNSISTLSHRSEVTETCPGRENQRILGSFSRLLDHWLQREPGTNVRELVQRVLESIHGVDVNPYAIAIARFRLLLAAMKACDVRRLADIPALHLNLACGDSLFHGS